MAALSSRLVAHPASPTRAERPADGRGRLPLVAGAVVTVVAAVAFDMLAGEHPTHTLGLALVAVAVAGVRLRMAGRQEGVLSAVSGALVAQPALHATAKLNEPAALGPPDGLLHVVVSDGPATAMQVAASVAVVLAVALSGRLAQMLLTALHRPIQLLGSGPPPVAPMRTPVAVSVQRHGSMLRWCGWSIRAARRGPPSVVVV